MAEEKRKTAWHKEYRREVPYNPLLEKNPAIEIREEGIEEPVGQAETDQAPAGDQVPAEPVPGGAPGAETEVDQLSLVIVEAGKLDPENEAHFTKSGVPDARVLTERCGFMVTADLRDEAWAAVQGQTEGE